MNDYSYLNSAVYEAFRKAERRQTIKCYILGGLTIGLNVAVTYGILRLIFG